MIYISERTIIEEFAKNNWFPHYWVITGIEDMAPIFCRTRQDARSIKWEGEKIIKVENKK